MIEIVEKIAVKSKIISTVPGKKYCRYISTGRNSGDMKAAPHPRADEQPEDDRRQQGADDAVPLAEKSDQFPLQARSPAAASAALPLAAWRTPIRQWKRGRRRMERWRPWSRGL